MLVWQLHIIPQIKYLCLNDMPLMFQSLSPQNSSWQVGKALLETREKDRWADYLGSKEIFCQQQNLLLDRTAFGRLCSFNAPVMFIWSFQQSFQYLSFKSKFSCHAAFLLVSLQTTASVPTSSVWEESEAKVSRKEHRETRFSVSMFLQE